MKSAAAFFFFFSFFFLFFFYSSVFYLSYDDIMSESIRFFSPPDDQRERVLHAVTITLTNPPSYDPLPTNQTCEDGKIHIYSCPLEKEPLGCLIRVFENRDKDDLSEMEIRLSKDIAEATDTVLNFECCDGMGSADGFKTVDNNLVMELVNTVLERGGLVLFSDFSLKALIHAWKPEFWGPIPFVNMGCCSGYVKIRFDPKVLQQCPLGQLRAVGDLCANSSKEEEDIAVAGVNAMINTIVYGLSPEAMKASEYSIQVLTIVTDMKLYSHARTVSPKDKDKVHQIGKYAGFLGHVLLTFRGGGQILTSAVHWKDLLDMDVSMDAMEKMLSKKDVSDLKTKLDSCTSPTKKKDIMRSKYTSYVSRYSASRKGEYFTMTPSDSKTTTENDSGPSGYSKVSAMTPSSTRKPYAKSHYSPGTILAESCTEKEKERIEEPTTRSHKERRNIYVSGLALCDPN